MLSNKSGNRLNKYIPDYVLFDLETTGLSCQNDEVVEMSALKVRDGLVVEEFSTLVNPGIPIPFYASDVNGITDEMVADYPFFDSVLAEFIEFAGDDVLVGHNIASFDMKFIQRDAQKYFGKVFGNDYIDTLQLARIYLPELEHHTLTDLARYYHINTAGAHRALADCKMNQRIFESLKDEMDNPSEAAKAVKKCPKCGNLLKKRIGKFGEFCVRDSKKDTWGNAAPYNILGFVEYVQHNGSKPMNVIWKLEYEIPAKYIKHTRKMLIG